MLYLETNKYGVKLSVDLHALPLPSGIFCHKLDRTKLFQELKQLGVPDIDACQGHQELSLRYAGWRQQQAEAAPGDKTNTVAAA